MPAVSRINRSMPPPSGPSARHEQRVERSPAFADFLQPWILQPAMPIEPDRAVQIAALDQQLGCAAGPRRILDRLLQRIAREAAGVDSDNRRAVGQAGIERRSVPE